MSGGERFRRISGVSGALIALVAMAISSSALAATVVNEIQFQNVVFPVEDVFKLPKSICGVKDKFTGDFTFEQFRLVLWDNGHFVLTTTNSVTLFDSAGNLILRDRAAGSEIEGEGSLPHSFQVNLVPTCTGHSATPGLLVNVHFGFTVAEDGTLTKIRGSMCADYAFC